MGGYHFRECADRRCETTGRIEGGPVCGGGGGQEVAGGVRCRSVPLGVLDGGGSGEADLQDHEDGAVEPLRSQEHRFSLRD